MQKDCNQNHRQWCTCPIDILCRAFTKFGSWSGNLHIPYKWNNVLQGCWVTNHQKYPLAIWTRLKNSSDCYTVSEKSLGGERLHKFKKSTDDDLRKLPPSREALLQHTKRACFQAGYIWEDCQADLFLPDPKLWGWVSYEEKGSTPLWLADESAACLETFVTTCTFKTGKCEHCKCKIAEISYIVMCGYNKGCEARKMKNKSKKKGKNE